MEPCLTCESLFVHAHPDDESIETGATMAKYAAEGAYVCLVTCTRGEEGEVIPEDLRHLSGRRAGGAPRRRAGAGLRRPGRGRPSLPRRRGALARLRDDGHALQQRAPLLLAGRRRRGDRGAGPGRTRGAPAGDRDLRRQRLRTAIPTTSRPTGWPGVPSSGPRTRPSARASRGRPSRFYATAIPLPRWRRRWAVGRSNGSARCGSSASVCPTSR